MSSYFDALMSEMSDASLDDIIGIEERVIKEVSLVTGDREFPDDLRERIQILIAVKRIQWINDQINEAMKAYAEAVGYSGLVEDLHSMFHEVASERIKTRFGILSDSPSGILAMRKDHDEEKS